jgi:hypothetical protein
VIRLAVEAVYFMGTTRLIVQTKEYLGRKFNCLVSGIAAFSLSFSLWSKSMTTIRIVHFGEFPHQWDISPGKNELLRFASPWNDFGEWKDYPAGGVSTWGTSGNVLVDVGQEGWLKHTLQPNFLNISSHWIRNVGVKPYKIRLEMSLCDFELDWDTPEANWDQATHSTTLYIPPSRTFNMDWNFHIPPEKMQQAVVCKGQLEVFDAETGDSLTVLPITILNSRATQ